MKNPLLDGLQRAPSLLIACKVAGVLKELRAVSRTARRLATSSVTTVTVLLGNESQQADVLRIMRACRLTMVLLHETTSHPSVGWGIGRSSEGITYALAATLGSTMGSVTDLGICFYPTTLNARDLALGVALTTRKLAPYCKALTSLSIRIQQQAHLPFLALQIPILLNVGCLLPHLDNGLIKRLTYLDIQAWEMHTNGTLHSSTLLPLNDQDFFYISKCTSLKHLHLQISVYSQLNWNALPRTLETLQLNAIRHGPELGTCLPRLRLITMMSDCDVTDLELLLRCSPVLESVHMQDVTADTNLKSLLSFRSIQRFADTAAAALKRGTGSMDDMSQGSSISSLGSGNTATTHSPIVHARGLRLRMPRSGGLTFSSFLQQMQPIPCLKVCSFWDLLEAAADANPFVSYLNRVFPDLQMVSLMGCRLLNSDLLTLGFCSSLQAVHVAHCVGVTDVGVVDLARRANRLLILEVQDCPEVTWMGRQVVQEALQARSSGPKVTGSACLLQVQSASSGAEIQGRRQDAKQVAVSVKIFVGGLIQALIVTWVIGCVCKRGQSPS